MAICLNGLNGKVIGFVDNRKPNFDLFLERVETRDTVRGWESEAGESSWPLIRNAALAMVAIAIAVVALTQQQAMQTVTLVLTGVGTVLAGLTQVSGFFTARRNGQAPTAQSQ